MLASAQPATCRCISERLPDLEQIGIGGTPTDAKTRSSVRQSVFPPIRQLEAIHTNKRKNRKNRKNTYVFMLYKFVEIKPFILAHIFVVSATAAAFVAYGASIFAQY